MPSDKSSSRDAAGRGKLEFRETQRLSRINRRRLLVDADVFNNLSLAILWGFGFNGSDDSVAGSV